MLIVTTPDLPTMHNYKGWQWLIHYYHLNQASTYTVSETLPCCIQGPLGLHFSRMVRNLGQHHSSPGFQEPHYMNAGITDLFCYGTEEQCGCGLYNTIMQTCTLCWVLR